MIIDFLLSHDWIVKSALFLVGVMLVLHVLRAHTSASFRHVIWVMGFLGMMIIFSLSVVTWEAKPSVSLPVELSHSSKKKPKMDFVHPPLNPTSFTAQPEIPSEKTPKTSDVSKSIDWSFWLKRIWAAGALVYFLILLFEKLALQFLYWKSREDDGPIYDILDELRLQLNLRKPVKVILSSYISLPFISGWNKPIIFLPKTFLRYEAEKLRFVLIHELAHVHRKDNMTTLLKQISCGIFWFNPLVWWAVNLSKIDMEIACDDFVIRANQNKYDYASFILDILEEHKNKAFLNQTGLTGSGKKEIQSRMKAILNDDSDHQSIKWPSATMLTLLGLFVAVPFACVHLVDSSSETNVDLDHFIGVLNSENEEDQKYAAWVLGTSENEKSVDGLIGQLQHPNPEVRSMILWALGELKVISSLPHLIKMTKDPIPLVREMAVKSIGEMEDPKALPELHKMMLDPDPGVRTAAIWSMGEVKAFGSLDIYYKALNDPSTEAVKMAIKVIGKSENQEAIPVLATFLGNPNLELKMEAIHALGEMDTQEVLPYLINLLDDRDASVRAEGVRALGHLGDKGAVSALMPLLHDPAIPVRELTVWALDELTF